MPYGVGVRCDDHIATVQHLLDSEEGSTPGGGESPKEIYGLKSLPQDLQSKAQEGTLLALRAANSAQICKELAVTWIAETPR